MMMGGESYLLAAAARGEAEGIGKSKNQAWDVGMVMEAGDAHTITIWYLQTDGWLAEGRREWAEQISHYSQNTQTYIEQFSIFRGAAITHFSACCSSWIGSKRAMAYQI